MHKEPGEVYGFPGGNNSPAAPRSIIQPLNHEFTQVSEMNILRDKINEIIKQL